jgi:hypothetical protein
MKQYLIVLGISAAVLYVAQAGRPLASIVASATRAQ